MNSLLSVSRHGFRTVKFLDSHKTYVNLNKIRRFSITFQRNMKLVQFVYKNEPNVIRLGFINGETVVDVNKADSSLPSSLIEVLKNNVIEKVKR